MEKFDSSYWKNISIILQRNDDKVNNISLKLTYQFYSPMILMRIVLTILLRIGFIFVHIGMVPVTNINLILLQNLVDFSWTTLVYFLVGFIFSYSGDSNNGMIGGGHWIGESNINNTEALIGWQVVSITSAIFTSGVIGRLHSIGCLISTILLAGVVQPLIIHWAWNSNGWMIKNNFFDKTVSFEDHSGAAIIHVVGGICALIGCLTLGRRILKLKDIDRSSITSSSPAIVMAGYFLIFLGLQDVSSIDISEKMEEVLINNFLAASASSLVVIILYSLENEQLSDYWKITRCIQSVISGLVAVSGGPDFYSPTISILFGSLSGLIFYPVSEIVFKSAVEDNCNIISTHLISGFLGSLLAPLNAYRSKDVKSILIDIMWQATCLVAIMGAVIIIMLPIFLLLKIFGCLRNHSEFLDHLRSTVALKNGPIKLAMQRIFAQKKEKEIFLKPGLISNLIQKNFNRSFFELAPKSNLSRSQKESCVPLEESKTGTDFGIKGENIDGFLHVRGSRKKRERNVYTIQSLTHQTKDFSDIGESNFEKNGIDLKLESQKKSYSFQGFGAGDSFFNQFSAVEKENEYTKKVKVQENEDNEMNKENMKKEILKIKEPSYEIHRTPKLMNLAKLPLSKSSIDFIFGPQKNFASAESLEENPEFLRRNFSEINLEPVSQSSQQIPTRKSF